MLANEVLYYALDWVKTIHLVRKTSIISNHWNILSKNIVVRNRGLLKTKVKELEWKKLILVKNNDIDIKNVNSVMRSLSQIPVIGMAVPTLYTLDNLIKELISTEESEGECSGVGKLLQHVKEGASENE